MSEIYEYVKNYTQNAWAAGLKCNLKNNPYCEF